MQPHLEGHLTRAMNWVDVRLTCSQPWRIARFGLRTARAKAILVIDRDGANAIDSTTDLSTEIRMNNVVRGLGVPIHGSGSPRRMGGLAWHRRSWQSGA